eukprot:snap_masked-scaffold_5-processed-gene-1.43-mRNA-1 protein AED:1.00 eAED:1.00 QI:0/-1/0/0/-1/1/1/0/290
MKRKVSVILSSNSVSLTPLAQNKRKKLFNFETPLYSSTARSSSNLVNEEVKGDTSPKGYGEQEPEELKTLVIFDYDDTLLPTKFIQYLRKKQKVVSAEDLILTENQKYFFQSLDALVVEVLNKSINISRKTTVVTNGSLAWVKVTSRKFLPETFKMFFLNQEVEVISARDAYKKQTSDSVLWKKLSFKKLFRKFFEEELHRESQQRTPLFVKNVISIGDGQPEEEAAKMLTNACDFMFVKSVLLTGKHNCTNLYLRLTELLDILDEAEATEKNDVFDLNSVSKESILELI